MPKWVRVRDKSTGHEFDLAARAVDAYGDAIERVKGVEPHDERNPRPATHNTKSAGTPAESAKEKAR